MGPLIQLLSCLSKTVICMESMDCLGYSVMGKPTKAQKGEIDLSEFEGDDGSLPPMSDDLEED